MNARAVVLLVLVAVDVNAATWFTRSYSAAIFDWCIDRHGQTAAATTCMRDETRAQREAVRHLQSEVRGSSEQQRIYEHCDRQWGRMGQQQVRTCVQTEAAMWRRRNPG